jgi:hypothetical protein
MDARVKPAHDGSIYFDRYYAAAFFGGKRP